MSSETCLTLTLRLISFAVLLQTLEILQLKNFWSIWSWQALKEDYRKLPLWLSKVVEFLLRENVFRSLLILQLVLALVNINFPTLWGSLAVFLLALVQLVRWRGFFNGGSDSMTFTVLLVCILALIFKDSPRTQNALLWYLGLQAVLSYFVAGIVKAKHKGWWNGRTLEHLLKNSSYAIPSFIRGRTSHLMSLALSLALLAFELLSPLALLNKNTALIFMAVAVFFHFGNFVIFGLNRFLFAWIAAYPALYFLAGFSH